MFFFFKQKTAYGVRISDWSSDVCSSDLRARNGDRQHRELQRIEAGEPRRKGVMRLRQSLQHRATERHAEPRAEQRPAIEDEIRAVPLPFGKQEIGRASCRERVCQAV